MVLIIIGICALFGCGGSSSYDKKYNEIRTMSFLKNIKQQTVFRSIIIVFIDDLRGYKTEY